MVPLTSTQRQKSYLNYEFEELDAGKAPRSLFPTVLFSVLGRAAGIQIHEIKRGPKVLRPESPLLPGTELERLSCHVYFISVLTLWFALSRLSNHPRR